MSDASDNGTSAFQFLMHMSSLFSAPTKLMPLSDQNTEGVPRLEITRTKVMTLELVSMDGINSVMGFFKQVSRKPDRVSEDLQAF